MEIKFNVHGRQRKELVTKLADYTHQKAEYEYTPTYAYQIGKYTVNKDGVLTSPSEIPANLLDYLEQQGFHPNEIIKVNHSRLKSGACENCPSGATTTICLDTAFACKQVLRATYQSLDGPQVARRTY